MVLFYSIFHLFQISASHPRSMSADEDSLLVSMSIITDSLKEGKKNCHILVCLNS